MQQLDEEQQRILYLTDMAFSLTMGSLALGGIILLALMVNGRRRYAFSAIIGAIAAILIEPALKHHFAPTPVPPLMFYLGFGIILAILAAIILRAVLDYFAAFRDKIRDLLDPSRWPSGPGYVHVEPKDQVKRWFVTTSAATGAVVGSVLTLSDFWHALGSVLIEPRNALIALLLVTVSMFLIGPVQAYVFDWGAGAKSPSEPSKKIADVLAAGDWRAVGRFGQVLFIYVCLYFLTSSVGSTVKLGGSCLLSMIIVSAITPAVVSYYWSAALQRASPSVQAAASEPSLFASGVMYYGLVLPGVVILAMALTMPGYGSSPPQSNSILLLFSPVIAIIAALLLSAVTTFPFALAGGYTIDRFSGWRGMIYLGLALVGVAVTEAVGATAVGWLVGLGLDSGSVGAGQAKAAGICVSTNVVEFWLPLVLSTAGWTAGLWVSGFPRLVTAGRQAKN